MDEKIKYIFFIFLGIIFYLIFFKKELVEGATCRARTIEWMNIGSAADKRWSRSDASRGDCSGIYADVSTIANGVNNRNLSDNVPIKIDNVAYSKVEACRILDAAPGGPYCRHQPHVDAHCSDRNWYGTCATEVPVQQERCDGGPNRPGLPNGFGGYCSSRTMGNINGSTFCTKTSFCELHCGRHEIRDESDCKCVRGYGRTNTNSRTDNCEQCEIGHHRNDSEDRCDPCNSGTYQSQAGQNSCELCQLKKYQSRSGQSTCTDITPGHQTNQPNTRGATSQVECSYNHYNDTNYNVCQECHNGSEPVAANNNYVISAAVKCKCLPGFAPTSDGNTNNPTCAICDNPQQHHHKSGDSACEDCPPGFIAGELGGKWQRSDNTCAVDTDGSFTNSEAFDVNSDLNVNPLKKLDGTPIRDSTGTNLSTITGNEKDCKIICGRDHRCKSFSLSADSECTFFKNIPTCNKGGNSDPYLHSLNRYDNNLGTWKIRGGGTSEKENLVYKTPGFCPLKCPSGTQPNPERTRCIECLDNTAGVDGSCDNTCDNQISNETLQGCSPCNDNEYVLDGICTPCPYRINSDGRCVTENEIEAFTNYEGYTNYDELNTKCAISRNTIPCSSDINNNISNGWTYNDITKNYVNKGAYNEIPDDLYIANSCSGDLPGSNQYYKNSFYDKLCFKNGEDEDFERGLIISGSGVNNLAEVYVKSEEECSEKCNEFSECGAFEYNDRCCIYKIGYGSSEGTEGNCHKKKIV